MVFMQVNIPVRQPWIRPWELDDPQDAMEGRDDAMKEVTEVKPIGYGKISSIKRRGLYPPGNDHISHLWKIENHLQN